jgi:hypothetical protein
MSEFWKKNWTANKKETTYAHKFNPNMVVKILKSHDPVNASYFIYHTHPGYNGIVIPQKMERATTKKRARELVIPHLHHWDDHKKWMTDPDFGKAN